MRFYELHIRRTARVCDGGRDYALAPCYSPYAVAAIVHKLLDGDCRENMFAILLDQQNRIAGVERIAIGSISGVDVHPRETFRAAILTSASAIVLAHNHPSGDPTPSGDDIALTVRFLQASKVLGIPLLDHVVVGDSGKLVSMSERRIGGFE